MIWSLLIGILPKLVLGGLQDWNQRKLATDTSEEKTRREVAIASLKAEMRRREVMEETRRHAMSFRLFWVPWLMASVPWALWFGLGMMDSAGLEIVTVHALPPQLERYADAISASLFGSGAVAMTGQSIARAIARR